MAEDPFPCRGSCCGALNERFRTRRFLPKGLSNPPACFHPLPSQRWVCPIEFKRITGLLPLLSQSSPDSSPPPKPFLEKVVQTETLKIPPPQTLPRRVAVIRSPKILTSPADRKYLLSRSFSFLLFSDIRFCHSFPSPRLTRSSLDVPSFLPWPSSNERVSFSESFIFTDQQLFFGHLSSCLIMQSYSFHMLSNLKDLPLVALGHFLMSISVSA